MSWLPEDLGDPPQGTNVFRGGHAAARDVALGALQDDMRARFTFINMKLEQLTNHVQQSLAVREVSKKVDMLSEDVGRLLAASAGVDAFQLDQKVTTMSITCTSTHHRSMSPLSRSTQAPEEQCAKEHRGLPTNSLDPISSALPDGEPIKLEEGDCPEKLSLPPHFFSDPSTTGLDSSCADSEKSDGSACLSPCASDLAFSSRRTRFGSFKVLEFTAGAALLRAASVLNGHTRSATATRIWNFLEDPESSRAAFIFANVWNPIIVATAAISLLQAMDPPLIGGLTASALELSFDAMFALEFLLRCLACASCGAFVRDAYNLIDMLAALALVPRVLHTLLLLSGETSGTVPSEFLGSVLFGVVPVVRLSKTLRRLQKFYLFLTVIGATIDALAMLLFTLTILLLAFSAAVFLAEPRENIASLPHAMFFVLVTMSTVGYGDVTPQTTAGTMVTGVIIISSVLYMAMPIGIVGNAFTQVWDDRDRILLMRKTRDRLNQWGYTAGDMPALFSHFDPTGEGELGFADFNRMLMEMGMGIDTSRVAELFESLDKDGSGAIDAGEFTRSLFPSHYHDMLADCRSGQGLGEGRLSELRQSGRRESARRQSEQQSDPRQSGRRESGRRQSEQARGETMESDSTASNGEHGRQNCVASDVAEGFIKQQQHEVTDLAPAGFDLDPLSPHIEPGSHSGNPPLKWRHRRGNPFASPDVQEMPPLSLKALASPMSLQDESPNLPICSPNLNPRATQPKTKRPDGASVWVVPHIDPGFDPGRWAPGPDF